MRLTQNHGNVPALARSLQILARLEAAGIGGMGAHALQASLKIPRASLFRLLHTLAERDLISQDPYTGRYRLGMGLLKLGYAARRTSPLVMQAQATLHVLTRKTRLMSELAMAVGSWKLAMLDVWLAEGTPVKVQSRPGMQFELDHQTAHGLCYLAFDHAHRLDAFARAKLNGTAPEGLLEHLARGRAQGYAWFRQRGVGNRPGNARVAVPVIDPHTKPRRLTATLALVCDSQEMTSLRAAQWAQILKEHARALEAVL